MQGYDDVPLVSMGNHVSNLQGRLSDRMIYEPKPAVFDILPTTDINSE